MRPRGWSRPGTLGGEVVRAPGHLVHLARNSIEGSEPLLCEPPDLIHGLGEALIVLDPPCPRVAASPHVVEERLEPVPLDEYQTFWRAYDLPA